MSQQQPTYYEEQEPEQKVYPVGVQAKFFAAPLLAMLPIDVLAHLGLGGMIFGGIVAYGTWKLGPDLYEDVREQLPFLPSLQPPEPGGEKVTTLIERRSNRPLLARLFGMDSIGAAYEEPDEQSPTQPNEQGQPDEQVPASAHGIPAQFEIGPRRMQFIKAVNNERKIYFGDTAARTVCLSLDDMYHVLDIANSGNGKSNRFRLAMMQVVTRCETYFINPFANNVKPVKDSRKIEVWKPIFDRLANGRPIKDGAEILSLMNWLMEEINTRIRQEEEGDFSWMQRPIFVFIDELPEVFARCPQAIELLDRIGRTGRQFRVFAWAAAQTAVVKDIGQSTAAQAQYKTRIYGGGDRTSSGRMMKGTIPVEQEQALQSNGAGLTLMLAEGFSDREFVRAPLVTNESLFAYLGLPPFKIEDWLAPMTGNQPAKTTFTPFTLLPDEAAQAQKTPQTVEEKGKTEKGKRVKGLHDDAILDALDELEEEGKPLTLHAIAKTAQLTRHQYSDIEEIAIEYGYELDRGKGRPAKED